MVVILLIVFSIFLVSILLVDKISENKVLEYIDLSYEKSDEFIREESKQIGVEKVEELNELKRYNKSLKKDIKKHKGTTYTLFAISSLTLISLVYAIKMRVDKHREGIEKMLLVDEVTGGDSRAAFYIKMDEAVKNNSPNTYTVALLNVRNFKLINNNFGFLEGDKILKNIYYEIEKHLNKGEWEYSSKYSVQFAFGLALVEDTSMDYRTIMNYARFSCSNYKKTREFKNYSKIVEELSRENRLNYMFENSLKNGEFKVYLQPKMNIKNNRCRGAEALVRWIHPEEGMISPGEFIGLFEENDKIIELDFYVFEEVCKIIKSWIDNDKNVVPISVNLSRKHLKNTVFIDKFVDIKNKYSVPDGLIEFEILESVALDDEKINILISILNKIHQNGFLCSLDDFGSGYSLLSVLSELRVDTIKLDRKFFRDFEDERSKNVIESFINVCERINTKVVAEGIESKEQLDYLRKVNCELVQGFIFSKPIDVESFEKSFLI